MGINNRWMLGFILLLSSPEAVILHRRLFYRNFVHLYRGPGIVGGVKKGGVVGFSRIRLL